MKNNFQVLALLASKGVTVEDRLEQTNVWLSEHASDSNVVLDNLGVYEERRLKSTAQIVFLLIVQGIDDALENVFKSFEEKLGESFLQQEK